MIPLSKVNGFMVVRVPEDAGEPRSDSRVARAPAIGKVLYRGFDRLAWWDLGNLRYGLQAVPDWLQSAYGLVKDPAPGFLCLQVCADLDLSRRLLEASNASGHMNEVIAVQCRHLDQVLGEASVPSTKVRWMGVDPYVVGEFSLLRSGLYSTPSVFSEWQGEVNEFGLFESVDLAEAYVGAYLEQARGGRIEQLATEPHIDFVRVGSLAYEASV